MIDSLLALYTNFQGSSCLTHVDTEGSGEYVAARVGRRPFPPPHPSRSRHGGRDARARSGETSPSRSAKTARSSCTEAARAYNKTGITFNAVAHGQKDPRIEKAVKHCDAIATAAEKLAMKDEQAADFHTPRCKELEGK